MSAKHPSLGFHLWIIYASIFIKGIPALIFERILEKKWKPGKNTWISRNSCLGLQGSLSIQLCWSFKQSVCPSWHFVCHNCIKSQETNSDFTPFISTLGLSILELFGLSHVKHVWHLSMIFALYYTCKTNADKHVSSPNFIIKPAGQKCPNTSAWVNRYKVR